MPEAKKSTGGYLLYASTIFLSAFLLFAIQPIVSKHLLPYFGGSSSVWATSLLFFTTILFVGYAYVYFITSLSKQKQFLVHSGALLVAGLATIAALSLWGSIYPPLDWLVGNLYAPAFNVLLALSVVIAVPYFLLSTTGPLLQYWYGVSSSAEPYKLYALSNAGSLLALLSYPFLIEPFIPLRTEEHLWIFLFLMYAILCAAVTYSYFRTGATASHEVSETFHAPSPLRAKAQWIGYAALPAFLLVATTTVITQLISPVPLLWVMPLSLYLISFILAFRGWGQSIFMAPLVLAAGYWAYHFTPASPSEIVPHVSSYLAFLFLACLFCHAKLYAMRPNTRELPFFYLCTSFGGMVGTLLGSMLAPLVFSDFWEFPLGLAITMGVAAYALSIQFFPRIVGERMVRMLKIVFPFVLAVLFTNFIAAEVETNAVASRNFYGAVKLRFEPEAVVLQHGTTVHGLQPTAREWSFVPTTYYTQGSGVGRAIRYAQDVRDTKSVRVGVVGLGTGTLASYCRDNDSYVFYEIDPRIKEIATRYFSYLSRCDDAEVRVGDGRIVLESEGPGAYDVLAVDAFTDDAIPVHLLTREAVELYTSHLRDERSIIAIHTSNRYLTLAPVLLRITRELGMSAMVVGDSGEDGEMGSSSQWVLLARDARVFDDIAFTGVDAWEPPATLPQLWTDTYTSLFSVLSLPKPW